MRIYGSFLCPGNQIFKEILALEASLSLLMPIRDIVPTDIQQAFNLKASFILVRVKNNTSKTDVSQF